MNLRKLKLKQIIKEELSALLQEEESPLGVVNDNVWDAHKVVIENVQRISRDMNEEDSYAFLTLLKNWFNKNVLEEQ
mgnify:CR=1 FL=1|tara:strand:- start:3688 stop:3918 length:231 start_codon:yes stop_codon:yes gene_type:complete